MHRSKELGNPLVEKGKPYSDGNTTITWWKNKKKMEFSGDKADEIKLKLCNVLIATIPSVNNKSVQDDNRSHLNAEQSKSRNYKNSAHEVKF